MTRTPWPGSGPPCWISRSCSKPTRLHIDLDLDDLEAEVARVLALGARHADVGQGHVPWVVLTDPEGNEFCILQPHRSLID